MRTRPRPHRCPVTLDAWETPWTEGPAGPYTIFSKEGKQLAGMMNPPAPDIPPNWLVYFDVSDAEAAAQAAVEGGGHIEMSPMAIPDVGTFAVFTDPQGAAFAVLQPERAAG